MTNNSAILFSSSPAPAKAIAELFVLLTLANKPVEESDLVLFDSLRDGLSSESPFYDRLLASLTQIDFIEALGKLHGLMPMEAARQKLARDLGKNLATLPRAEKERLCVLVRTHFTGNADPLFQIFCDMLQVKN